MKIEHPNTEALLVMHPECPLVAEMTFSNSKCVHITIGDVGFSGGLSLPMEEWEGFKKLILEIAEALEIL